MANLYRCIQPFSFDWASGSRVVAADDVVSTNEPAFADRQALFDNTDLFEPLENYVQRRSGVTEQATAAPGEKRSVTPPADPPKRTTRGRKAAEPEQKD